MIPLPHLALYRVSGADAEDFLHGQLAADIVSLKAGEACFAAYCNPRGQAIGLLLVRRDETDWLIGGHAGLMDSIVQRLRRFVLRARVEFTPASMRLAGLGPDERPADVLAPRGTGLRYGLCDDAASSRGDADAWRENELMQGVLWLQPETSERFVPQMLGLERIGAVSFRKGCYPGQEIIARARYLGKVKRLPAWLALIDAAAPEVGADCVIVSGGNRIDAIIVDAAPRVSSGWLMVAVAALEESTAIEAVEVDGVRVLATRLASPG